MRSGSQRRTCKSVYLQIEFLDTGPGVPPTSSRASSPPSSPPARGLGLGLSIVKGILEAHRGSIVEVGASGQGAHFIAFLPAKGN